MYNPQATKSAKIYHFFLVLNSTLLKIVRSMPKQESSKQMCFLYPKQTLQNFLSNELSYPSPSPASPITIKFILESIVEFILVFPASRGGPISFDNSVRPHPSQLLFLQSPLIVSIVSIMLDHPPLLKYINTRLYLIKTIHLSNITNMQINFTCPLCLELAKDAVQSSCCTKIYCHKCIDQSFKKFAQCPCCRSKNISLHPSRIARKVISEIKLPCEHCQANVENGMMPTHLQSCPKVKINCRLCNTEMIQAEFPKHTASFHQPQARDFLINFVLENKKKKNPPEPPKNNISNHNYFKPIGNRFGRKATLGTVAKYYCGGRLQGKCGCCDGSCGPDNGQNCDACMELDVARWKLAKTYLINTAGYICQVIRAQGTPKVTCFRITGFKGNSLFGNRQIVTCKLGSPCPSCQQVEYSISIGRYNGLY